MTINDSALNTSAWIEIKDLIKNNKSSFTYEPSVYGKLPDVDPSFPSITISPVNKSLDDFAFTSGDTIVANKRLVCVLRIYAKKNEEIAGITDDVTNLFFNNNISGLSLVGFEEDDAESYPNDNKIKIKIITLTFNRRS